MTLDVMASAVANIAAFLAESPTLLSEFRSLRDVSANKFAPPSKADGVSHDEEAVESV